MSYCSECFVNCSCSHNIHTYIVYSAHYYTSQEIIRLLPIWRMHPKIENNACSSHLRVVPHICVSESRQHGFRKWLVAYSAPSHYLNQCCFIVNWPARSKLQWNFNQNTKVFIREIASENIVCGVAIVLSGGRWVKLQNCPIVLHRMWWHIDRNYARSISLNGLRPIQNGRHFLDEISNAFSKYHWSLFLRVQLTISQHWFAWTAPNHYLNQWWSVCWRIYVSLRLTEIIDIPVF